MAEVVKIRGKVLTNRYTPDGVISGILVRCAMYPDLFDDWKSAPNFHVSGQYVIGSEIEVQCRVK